MIKPGDLAGVVVDQVGNVSVVVNGDVVVLCQLKVNSRFAHTLPTRFWLYGVIGVDFKNCLVPAIKSDERYNPL